MSKVALITGITGQDGSYLAEIFTGEGLRGSRYCTSCFHFKYCPYQSSDRKKCD